VSFGHHADEYGRPEFRWHEGDGDLGPCDPMDDLDVVSVQLRCLDCGGRAAFDTVAGEVREDCPACGSLNTEIHAEEAPGPARVVASADWFPYDLDDEPRPLPEDRAWWSCESN
jgi:hypothetical protein